MDRDPIMQYFDEVSESALLLLVKGLAGAISIQVPRNPERTIALRKLLECRDSLIRALATK